LPAGKPEAGIHAWFCNRCGHACADYNSCGNRHCNACGRQLRSAWLKQVKEWTLPCVHWHIVFTLPHEFQDLTRVNRELFYNLLFECGKKTLLRTAKKCRFLPSMVAMLHSWGQEVLDHLHSHSVVSCGGLPLDGSQWIDIAADDTRFSATTLATLYHHLFLKRILRLFTQGKLTIPDTLASITTIKELTTWLAPIAAKQWNVNVQKYVGATAVRDTRILKDDGRDVTLSMKNYRKGGALETITMSGPEFVRRFATHIVPPYCRRVRYAGLLSQGKRAELLARCRELLADRMPSTEEVISDDGDVDKDDDPFATPPDDDAPRPPRACNRCRSRNLILIAKYSPHENYSFLLESHGTLDAPTTKELEPDLATCGVPP
jgi:Putative transposase/Transposase zinc-binding domain